MRKKEKKKKSQQTACNKSAHAHLWDSFSQTEAPNIHTHTGKKHDPLWPKNNKNSNVAYVTVIWS